MDDTDLARRAADGDDAAFELIVRRNAPAAWKLARALLGDDFAADEAVQDAFLKAHRGLASFRGDAALSTWLLAITRRACIDRMRRKRATVVPLDEARRLRAAHVDASLRVAIEHAMAALAPVDREAFTLVDVLGYSREDAARVAGVPASTMRSRVARARERLAGALADDEDVAEVR